MPVMSETKVTLQTCCSRALWTGLCRPVRLGALSVPFLCPLCAPGPPVLGQPAPCEVQLKVRYQRAFQSWGLALCSRPAKHPEPTLGRPQAR